MEIIGKRDVLEKNRGAEADGRTGESSTNRIWQYREILHRITVGFDQKYARPVYEVKA